MSACAVHLPCFVLLMILMGTTAPQAQTNSSSSTQTGKATSHPDPALNAGAVSNDVYRNRVFGFSYKIPPGWVLRTEEMSAQEEDESAPDDPANLHGGSSLSPQANAKNPPRTEGRVLLAAFSRPPEAKGEDVNSSILIAAESVAAYPGLKEPVQYFGPLAEVAKAQGFAEEAEPYEVAIGAKTLVRQDFRKNVGSRIMRQCTLVMLARGYAVSFTFIAGTEEEVEELISTLDFTPGRTK
jgi:hypothetical protein